MTRRVLIFQIDPASAKTLTRYFLKKGDRVWKTSRLQEAMAVLTKELPDLAFIDLHAPENAALDLISLVSRKCPQTKVIVTNRNPDIRSELAARELGASVFLREPFTEAWINTAIQKAAGASSPTPGEDTVPRLPRVIVPMRVKITLPYILLALTFIAASLYLIGRYVFNSLQDRFTNQLIDAGKLSTDWMVAEEQHLLETLRLVSHTDGLVEAINNRDSNRLRTISLPILVNYKEEALDFIDLKGNSLLSLHHNPGGAVEDYDATYGDNSLAKLDFIQKVVVKNQDATGDKYAGLVRGAWGDTFYIAGPVRDLNNNLIGVILVGKSIPSLVKELREATFSHLSLYDKNGSLMASTLLPSSGEYPLDPGMSSAILIRQGSESVRRDLKIGSVNYSEIIGPWEARGGEDLGLIGVSLPQSFFVRPSRFTSLQAGIFMVLIFLAIILIGMLTARQITLPLNQIVDASKKVAEGDFQVKVQPKGNDEIMVLGHSFNYMIAGLQEGSIYRDLLGKTVSPQVRETLRQSFSSGELRLEGQNTIGTVLISDIRNFTALAEKEEPTTILRWLNDYFGKLVPIVNAYGAIVDKFEGDAMLAFFGILPIRLPPEESAYRACQAAIEIMAVIDEMNLQRSALDVPPLLTGIGVNTGTLMAGGLGTSDRLDYTIIGDTVNTTQRMQDLTRQIGETATIVGENTLTALRGRRGEFIFEPLGEHALKGKSELLWVYRLRPGGSKRSRHNGHPLGETEDPFTVYAGTEF